MKKLFILLLITIVFSSSASAFDRKGFSPTAPFGVFSTFSADSPNRNQVAIDLNFDFTREPAIKRLNLNLSYGLTDRVEIITNLPYNISYKNFFHDNGAEDLNFGFKHRFIDETTFLPAFAYMLYLSGNIGHEDFSTGGGIGAGFIVTKKIGPVKAHGNIIYFKPEKERLKETWNINLSSELKVSYNSNILFEIIGRKAINKNKIDLIEWRLGYRVRITDFSYTTVGVGFDIKNRTPDVRLLFGVSVLLPYEKKQLKRIVDSVY
jgi:hypothetical protein